MKRILCLLLALCALLSFAVFPVSAAGTAEVSESENENYRLGYRLGYSDAIYNLGEVAHRYDRYNSLPEKDNAAYEYGYHYGYTEGEKYEPGVKYGEADKVQLAVELEHLTVNGKAFSYDNYPLDSAKFTPVILGAREVGISAKGEIMEDYAFYLYIYNPFGRENFSLDGQTVQFGAYSMVTYGFDSDSEKYTVDCATVTSDDGRFVRLQIPVDRSLMMIKYNLKSERKIYIQNYSGLVYRVRSDGKLYPTPITKVWAGDTFNMVGSFATVDFNATTGDSLTIQSDLHYTSWRANNPKDKTGAIYNQINTVYFTIPREIYENYDFLYAISAKFLQLQSSPIVISNSAQFKNYEKTVGALSSPWKYSEVGGDVGLYYGRVLDSTNISVVKEYYDWYYGKIAKKSLGYYYSIAESCNNISYFFDRSDVAYTDGDFFQQFVSGADFGAYIESFTNAYGGMIDDLIAAIADPAWSSTYKKDFQELLDLLIKYGDINATLFEKINEYTLNYKFDEVYELEEWKQDKDFSFWKWVKGQKEFTVENTSVSRFEVIERPQSVAAQYADNISGLADEYYIAEADTGTFYDYLNSNQSNVVVLLRFAVTDYECHELGIDNEHAVTDGKLWMVKTAFFRGVTVSDLTFKKDGDLITYAVSAEPINAYPGLSVKDDQTPLTPGEKWENTKDQAKNFLDYFFGDGNGDSPWEQFKSVMKIVMLALVGCLLVFVLVNFVFPLLSPVFRIIGEGISSLFRTGKKFRKNQKIRQAVRQEKKRIKEEKRRKKKQAKEEKRKKRQ